MSDPVTLLKPLIDKLPSWVPVAFALLAIIWCVFKGFWEIRKTRAEARIAEWELKDRIDKKKAEIGALSVEERPSKVSAFPEITPVSRMIWYVSIALGTGNSLGFLFISISEPLTTLKAATMALSLFSSVWSYLTPVFLTLLRTIAGIIEHYHGERYEAALNQIEDLGVIRECDTRSDALQALVMDAIAEFRAGQKSIIIAPVHRDGKDFASAVREKMKDEGMLAREDQDIARLESCDLSEA